MKERGKTDHSDKKMLIVVLSEKFICFPNRKNDDEVDTIRIRKYDKN